MRSFIIILCCAVTVTSASGQFSLLKDANPGTGSNNGRFIWKLKPGTWMSSWDGGAAGQELWRTDGTTAGTSMIKDLNPGTGWGTGYDFESQESAMNGEYYFAGAEVGTTTGFYKTNGDPGNVTKIIHPFIPMVICNIDNTLYLAGGTTQYGFELYKSDGTAAGTVLLKDIRPGDQNGLYPTSKQPFFVKANGYIFFRANDGVHGSELWRTDGTAAGTQMVKDILDGSGDGLPSTYQYISTVNYMREWKGSLYFVAQSSAGNEELWKTNGTEAGTVRISQLNGTGYRPFVSGLVPMGDKLYFLYKLNDGNIRLFSTDGTTNGTAEVLNQGFSFTGEYLAQGVSLVYFSAFTPQTGSELWRSDGTAAGTFMIKDLNPGTGNGMVMLTYANCYMNWDAIYFSGDNGQTGAEIFVSNGSPGNATLVFDAEPGSTGSSPLVYSSVAGRLTAKLYTAAYGTEAWIANEPLLFPQLLSFTGIRDGVDAKLKWETRNEENTSYYEIEKSTDGNSFSKIGTVQALGGGIMQPNYLFADPSLAEGTYYYRLKVFHTNGMTQYSNVATVIITPAPTPPTTPVPPTTTPLPGSEIFKLYPNPANRSIKVSIGRASLISDELQVTDMLGRLVKKERLPSLAQGEVYTLDISKLAAGNYTLSLVTDVARVRSVAFMVY